jgi:hypothetical protein
VIIGKSQSVPHTIEKAVDENKEPAKWNRIVSDKKDDLEREDQLRGETK